MKASIYIIPLLIIFSGCKKFDYNTEDNRKEYINNKEELAQAVTAAYSKFADIFASGDMRNGYLYQTMLADDYDPDTRKECNGPGCWPQAGYGIPVLDDNNDTLLLSYGQARRIPENWKIYDAISMDYREFMDQAYRDLYKAILAQNYVLCQSKDQLMINDTVNILLGEIYYLRAYTYFRLTRLFGNVPLITDLDINDRVSRASFTEIYNLIESDLLMAINLLPVTVSAARVPYITPCRGTAKALLAEVYLTMAGYPLNDVSKYTLAAKQAKDVIDSASVFGFGLLDDFADLSDPYYGFNKEGVSIVHYSSDYPDYALESFYGIGYESNELARNKPDMNIAEVQFYNNYPGSYRKNLIYYRKVYVRKVDTATGMTITDEKYPRQITSNYPIRLRRFYFEHDDDREYTIYILRYAHTLLTYAEASARAGNINAMSYEAINQIRRRANRIDLNTPSKYDLTPDLSPKLFLDSVVWERAWELTTEPEGRWFDLVRLEMMGNLDELRDSVEANFPYESIQPGEYFFPIPKEDIFLNPNLSED